MTIRFYGTPVVSAVALLLAGPFFHAIPLESNSIAQTQQDVRTRPAPSRGVPIFEVDAAWPKPLPNKWAIGQVSGVAVDARDHIWIAQRGPSDAAAVPAPPVIEFDAEGNVAQAWGGPASGYEWPDEMHGISLDHKDNVWITASNPGDTHVLKFTRTGKFLLQIGRKGKSGGSDDTVNLDRPAQARVDPATNEVYIADGEGENHRVIVFDADTGAYRRHWGAYGQKPDHAKVTKYDPGGPPPSQFSTVHCLLLGTDGLVYVCDRGHDRIQMFRKDGTFVKEVFVTKQVKEAVRTGALFDLSFSPDRRFIYVADAPNARIWILLGDELRIVGSFGEAGTKPGQFVPNVHDMAVDSKGNIYTGEAANGNRVQKFVYKGDGR